MLWFSREVGWVINMIKRFLPRIQLKIEGSVVFSQIITFSSVRMLVHTM